MCSTTNLKGKLDSVSMLNFELQQVILSAENQNNLNSFLIPYLVFLLKLLVYFKWLRISESDRANHCLTGKSVHHARILRNISTNTSLPLFLKYQQVLKFCMNLNLII